jgi:hypothetical protein
MRLVNMVLMPVLFIAGGCTLQIIAFLRYIDHCSYSPCRARPSLPVKCRPKFISVIAWGARFRECSTPSARFNLCENYYSSALGATHYHDFRFLSLMAGDYQVAAEVAVEFEVLATGRRCRDEEMHLWNFDNAGKVTRMRHYVDTAKQIAAAQG